MHRLLAAVARQPFCSDPADEAERQRTVDLMNGATAGLNIYDSRLLRARNLQEETANRC